MRMMQIIRLISLPTILILLATSGLQAQNWFNKAQAIPVLETKIAALQVDLSNSQQGTPQAQWLEGSMRFYETLLDRVAQQDLPLSTALVTKSSELAHYATSIKDFNPLNEQQRSALVTEATQILSD